MGSMEATFRGMFGGPCPGCGESGELLAHDVTYGGYRHLRHVDGSGHEHLCTVPEEQGVLYTGSDGWRMLPRTVSEAGTRPALMVPMPPAPAADGGAGGFHICQVDEPGSKRHKRKGEGDAGGGAGAV